MEDDNYNFDSLSTSQICRIIYSGWDFQQALSALTFLMDEFEYGQKYSKIELRKFRCFEVNAIISFCRPFEQARGRTTLSLKAINAKLTAAENKLKDYLMTLRRKLVAHSDEDEMHFRCKTHELNIRKSAFVLPELVFDESLLLKEHEVYNFEELLHKLIFYTSEFSLNLAQKKPDILNFYKKPKSNFNE
jgi:hypothetical protein